MSAGQKSTQALAELGQAQISFELSLVWNLRICWAHLDKALICWSNQVDQIKSRKKMLQIKSIRSSSLDLVNPNQVEKIKLKNQVGQTK